MLDAGMKMADFFMKIAWKGGRLSGFGRHSYCFDGLELDSGKFELRRDDVRVHVEPQVLSLLILLVEGHGRMVTKDEIIDAIWSGRIVSETAIAAVIKSARKAIGDNGKEQRLIRTIHGKGFRFVGDVAVSDAFAETTPAATLATEIAVAKEITATLRIARGGRPSIAVLPFAVIGEAASHAIVADALPADIIRDLSRLHWLFVIARGSSFRFRAADVDPMEVGRQLEVRYCLTGSIEFLGREVVVSVALVNTTEGETIWAEHYRGSLAEMQQMRPDIEGSVVAALEVHIPQNEVRLARSRPAAELDAWASFHLGLDLMYRFNSADNARAAQLFERSLSCDPHFSRALGGLSFTHFQNAFMRFAENRDVELEAARALAHRAVEADRLDPFAYFNVGRSLWLEGRLEESISWFDRATSLSPNYAQGIYNRGLVGTMVGKVQQADVDLSLALELSPLDPLAYAMVSSRALTNLQMGDYEKAAKFGANAASMPGAHKHIELIAAFTAHLAGDTVGAQHWLTKAKVSDPLLKSQTFFRAFPFAHSAFRELIEKSLTDLGL